MNRIKNIIKIYFICYNRINRSVFMMFLFFTISISAFSQDPHFSQFYTSPLTLNPAMTGLFSGDVRFASTYRNQWKAVSTPFTTATVACDLQVLKKVVNERDVLGFGILGMVDQSNNKGLKSNFVTFSLGYNKMLDNEGFHRLGIGYQYTLTTKRADYTKFLFSRQFTPNGFDQSLPTGEPINGFTLNYSDYATGLLYSGMNYNEHNWYLGASYYHFTKPNESISGEVNRLEPRLTLHGGYNFPLSELKRIYFSGLYMKSAINEEKTGGAILESTLNSQEYETRVLTGLYYRWAESVIPFVGINTGNFQIGLSYDINISTLKTATETRGGFEMSLLMNFVKDEEAKKIPRCYNRF